MEEIREITEKACNTTNFSVLIKEDGENSFKIIYKDGVYIQESYNSEYGGIYWSDTRGTEKNNILINREHRFFIKNAIDIRWKPEDFTMLNELDQLGTFYKYSAEEKYNGMKCYVLESNYDIGEYKQKGIVYIDKNTGFKVKSVHEIDGKIDRVDEREFSIGTVADEDVAIPDYTGYTDKTVY